MESGAALAGALVEPFQHPAGQLANFGRALDGDPVAVGDGHHAEPALQMREVLVVLPEDEAGEAVIVEGEDDFGFLDDAGMEIRRIPALLRSCGHIVRWPQMPLPFLRRDTVAGH